MCRKCTILSNIIYTIHLLLIIFVITLTSCTFSSCSVTKPTIIPSTEIVNVRDSVVYNIVDSTVIHPVEVIKDIVPVYDTLRLETSLAEAEAYVDTTLHLLRGSIKNKEGYSVKIKYVDRIEYRDSIQIKEVPVPYEVEKIVRKNPWYFPIVLIFGIIGLAAIIICIVKLYVKARLKVT